ncbi:hypothetical protein ACRQ5Q_27435 [Bradyrhizobium sp. PMVTL-01]|uniref:hypothetical protein n=1 Tax=Bradyrhizobium sp. PMVTL-01 TaxID=3434999 RepID=UPI003F6EF64F
MLSDTTEPEARGVVAQAYQRGEIRWRRIRFPFSVLPENRFHVANEFPVPVGRIAPRRFGISADFQVFFASSRCEAGPATGIFPVNFPVGRETIVLLSLISFSIGPITTSA